MGDWRMHRRKQKDFSSSNSDYDGRYRLNTNTPYAIHNLGRTDAQYRIGNRRCRPRPAMKPKRAAVDIALPCTRAIEIRAAGEVPPMRGAPPDRPLTPTLLRAVLSQYSTVMEFN